jgi:hypothetical protein
VESITTDRGFSSEGIRQKLRDGDTVDNILPRSPRLMAEALKDDAFRAAQERRAQTEGRIGILKNVFIGDTLSGKGYDHQRIEVAWSILTHNLWVLARLALRGVREKSESFKDGEKRLSPPEKAHHIADGAGTSGPRRIAHVPMLPDMPSLA